MSTILGSPRTRSAYPRADPANLVTTSRSLPYPTHPPPPPSLEEGGTSGKGDPGLLSSEDLFRVGLVARAQMGQDVAELLELYGSDEPADLGATRAEGLLDLLEHFPNQAPREQIQRLLFQLSRNDDAKVRRRAYLLAEATEGESFLRLGLRDMDAGV